MVDWKTPRLAPRARLGAGAFVLLALGAAGGAGAVSLTRPTVEMAPTIPTAIAKLPQTSGVVTVKGQVAEVYGDRFVLQDGTGRALVDAGRDGSDAVLGGAMTVQGHYDNGQVHASYLVDPQGRIEQVGPPPRPRGPHGPGPHGDGPPPPGRPGAILPPPGGPQVASPPPPGAVGAPPAGTMPPPPAVGARTMTPAIDAPTTTTTKAQPDR